MTIETTEVIAPAEVADAMQAGFNKVRGDTHEESRPAEVAQHQAQDDAGAVDNTGSAAEAEPPVVDELQETKKALAELRAANEKLAQSQEKAFGHIGQLKNVIEELKGAGRAGSPIQVSADQFKNLRAEYGDEMAQALAEDLSGLSIAAGQQVDTAAIEKAITDKVEAKLQEERDARENDRKAKEMRFVRRAHSDFDEIRTSDEFKSWRAALPKEAQDALAKASAEYDSETIIDALNDFKKTRKPKPTNTRLEAVATPKGSNARGTPTVLPDSAGLEAGFKRVRPAGTH